MANRNLPVIDWLEIESSAPGKFIISGEYSVVYEKQAIAAAIDLRTKVVIRPNKDGKIRLNLKNFDDIREWPANSFSMCRLVTKFSDCLDYDDNMLSMLELFQDSRFKVSGEDRRQANDAVMAFLLLYVGIGDSYALSARPPIDVEVESTIPVGAGLGSSSALSVAICGALMRVFRVSAEKYIISKWALNIDKFFHGRPSGVDNNIITNGGYILFQSGKIKATGVTHEVPIKVMLIDTGVTRSTKALGKIVSDQLKEEPAKVEDIFNTINDITTHIWREMNSPNFVPRHIAADLQENQELLERLGVGHEKLTDICARAQRFNLTAKLTGAGGGGIAFVLYDDSNDEQIIQLRNELKNAGYHVRDHIIHSEGLVVKIKSDPERRHFM